MTKHEESEKTLTDVFHYIVSYEKDGKMPDEFFDIIMNSDPDSFCGLLYEISKTTKNEKCSKYPNYTDENAFIAHFHKEMLGLKGRHIKESKLIREDLTYQGLDELPSHQASAALWLGHVITSNNLYDGDQLGNKTKIRALESVKKFINNRGVYINGNSKKLDRFFEKELVEMDLRYKKT